MFTEEEKKGFCKIIKKFPNIASEFMHNEGSLDSIMWLPEQGYRFYLWDMETACRSGRLDVVKFIVKKCRRTWPEWSTAAIYYGQPEIATWLLKNGGRFHANSVMIAAIDKMQHAYSWLKQNLFAPLSPYLIIMAAQMGNLQVIKDMHAEGYPFPIDIRAYARGAGHRHIVAWFEDKQL